MEPEVEQARAAVAHVRLRRAEDPEELLGEAPDDLPERPARADGGEEEADEAQAAHLGEHGVDDGRDGLGRRDFDLDGRDPGLTNLFHDTTLNNTHTVVWTPSLSICYSFNAPNVKLHNFGQPIMDALS